MSTIKLFKEWSEYNELDMIFNGEETLVEIDPSNSFILSKDYPNSVVTDFTGNLQVKGVSSIPSFLSKIENFNGALHLSELNLDRLYNLPKNIKSLHLSNNNLTSLENIPRKVETLYIMFNKITSFEHIGEVNNIYARGCDLRSLKYLPIDMSGTLSIIDNKNLTSLEHCPSGIKSLNASGCGLTNLIGLPKNLITLDITLTPISDFLTKSENNIPSVNMILLNLVSDIKFDCVKHDKESLIYIINSGLDYNDIALGFKELNLSLDEYTAEEIITLITPLI